MEGSGCQTGTQSESKATHTCISAYTQTHTHTHTHWPLEERKCLLGAVKPRVPCTLTAATLNWYHLLALMSASWTRSSAVWGTDGGGAHRRGQSSSGVRAPCEFAATSVICVFLFAKLSKTLRLWGMCNRVQQSVSAVQHFHSCSMWHAGTCGAVTQIPHVWSKEYQHLMRSKDRTFIECVFTGFLPVPQSATPWHHPRWGGCHNSSGAAPHRGRAPRKCWTWTTSGSPADPTAAPKTPALSSASVGLLQEDSVTGVNIITVGELPTRNVLGFFLFFF